LRSDVIAIGPAGHAPLQMWGVQDWDNAGRRSTLAMGTYRTPFAFGYRADGLMTQVNDSAFAYADNGLLTNRINSSRTLTVTQRDGSGRLLQANTKVGAATVLAETLTWRNDGRLGAYTAARSDFTNTCNYSYSTLAQRLTQEGFNVASGQRVTNFYSFDLGTTGGLGVLTANSASGQTAATWSAPASGGLDGLRRVAQEQNTAVKRSATGKALGAATVAATLDSKPVSVQYAGVDSDGRWRSALEMTPGSHTLRVWANHPSGQYTAYATNSFTLSVTNGPDTALDQYDSNGNVTQRVWKNSGGVTNRTQTLTWDAFDRLVKVTDRDTVNSGFDWIALYDALGRRLRTTYTLVVSNAPITSPSSAVSVVDSFYDPEVEFLEIGVAVNGIITWKTYGPDASGAYGGMQGVGGLESFWQYPQVSSAGAVQDYFGNVLGSITNGTVSWNSTRCSSYGPVPGYESPALSLNVPLTAATGWRGRRVDETGLVCLGARPYDPTSGRFLSADPLGHASDPSLFCFAGGDPVNFFDPDGRLGKQISDNSNTWLSTPFGDLHYGPYGISYESGGIHGFLPYSEYTNPLEGAFDGIHPGQFAADVILNQSARDYARYEWKNADWHSPWGIAAGVTAGISYTANTIDAAANAIPIIGTGKAIVEDVVKAGIKGVGELFIKDAAKEAAELGTKDIASALHPTPHPLHPDSPMYTHPEGKTEYPGVDIDHRYSQTGFPERAHDPANLDLKPAVENRGPKAAWEKELLQYEEDLMQRTGWTRDQVRRRVTQSEWDSIARTVHPTTHPNMDRIRPKR
jgi:RHS repeat-associated protein